MEIIDSPGLNEHPDRTAITQKLLKDTDAAIFLTNASRSLTQGERDLLQDLRTQLNGGKEDEPADNLFVVGNFMDLVRTEKGRQQVQQRIERFVQRQTPIITGENRVHFIRKSEHWYSDHNQKEKLFQDYANQFIRDLSAELNAWVDKKIKCSILQLNTEVLDSEIRQGIEAIQRSLQILDLKTGSNLSNQLELSLSAVGVNMNIDSSIGSDITDAGGIGFFGSLGTGGLVAGALLAFTGLGLIPVALAGGAAALGLGWLFGEDQDAVCAQIKQSVFEQGFEKFNESAEQVFDKVCEHIASAFYNRVEAASGVIEQAISLSENFLEQQERLALETLEQCEAEKSRISQKRQEIEQVQSNIEAILNQCAKVGVPTAS